MKLLVTGGAGFIGSNFIRYWLKKYTNDKIINLDKLTYAGNLASTKDFSSKKNYKFVKGDVCNSKLVQSLIRDIDVVVHFAAESHVDRSVLGPSVFVKTNVLGTQVLLDAALRNKVKRFHYVSTDEVFGDLKLNSKEKFSEKTSYQPRNPYSASKAGADHLVRAYYHTYHLPISITNCADNYGPYQNPEKYIPRMITNLIDDKPLPIYGDGLYVRDWLYVEDHCGGIDAVINKGKEGETYMLGGLKKDINNITIAKMLLKMFKKDEKKYIKFVKDRLGHDRRYAIDWRKVKKELSWQPKHDFDVWLEKTFFWYKENEWWWRPLKKKAESLYEKTGQK